ncbi:MAG: helix-turn-helix transcriptional regulator [Bacillota bacterium]
MQFSQRQERIVEIVKRAGPITSDQIAKLLNLTRATLRPDLAILTMSGVLEARPRVGYFFSGKSARTLVAQHITAVRVRDIKSIPIVVRDNATVYDAAVTMFVQDVGTLFIVSEGGVLEGVVSRKDLLRTALGKADIRRMPVGVMMTRMPNVITATLDETVFMAAKKIVDHEVDALPVVRTIVDIQGTEKLEVVGRITKTSITKLLVEMGEGR